MTEPLKDVQAGMTGRAEAIVTRDLTVGAHVEGMPLVYATPMMIMLMEVASGSAVRGHLPPGWVTVGSRGQCPASCADACRPDGCGDRARSRRRRPKPALRR